MVTGGYALIVRRNWFLMTLKSSPEFRILMRFLRERKDISARALSEKSGLSLSYISKMENGDVTPTVEVFSKIITNLDLSQAELVYLIRILGEMK